MNRWENSNYYTRTFSPLLQVGIPRVNRFDFSIAQITACFTTPITIIPAQQGYVILPLWASIMRTTEYATQPVVTPGLKLHWLPPNDAGAAMNFGNTVLTAATTNGRYGVFNGAPAHAQLNGSDAAAAFGSKPLLFWSQNANPTVTAALPGSIVSLVLTWILLPTYVENVGGPVTPTT